MSTRLVSVCIFIMGLGGAISVHAAGEADLEAALSAADDRRYAEAFRLFVSSAAAGNVAAQRTAGLMALYGERLYGDEVRRNFTVARQWLDEAARQGDEVSRLLLRRQ
jgi:TPR repeat protein